MKRLLIVLLLWPALLCAAESNVLPLRPAFSAEQRAWLSDHQTLRVGLVMQAPWAQFDRRQQRLSGANVDLMNRLLQGMGVQGQWLRFADQDALEAALQRGEVDLAPGLQQTPQGLRRWRFSDPYLRVPHLVVGERRGSSAVDLDRIGRDEKVAVRAPSAVQEYLRVTHSNVQLQPVGNEREALDLLLRQEVSYAVVDEARLSLLLRETQFAGLSIIGDIGLPQLLRIGSRRDAPLLADILQRTLQALPGGELEQLQARWFPLSTRQLGNPLAFWKGVSVFLGLILLTLAAIVRYLLLQRRSLERQLLDARAVLSQREAAEQALRLSQFSIDNSTVGILWVNWDSHVRYANLAAERMLGYGRDALVDMPLVQLEPALSMDRWLTLWRQARGSQEPLPGFEIDCQRADGSRLPVDVSLSFLRFDQSEYLVVFITDVTERRRAQAALQESEARLKGIAGNVPGLVFRLERASAEQPVEFAYISEASLELVGYPAAELQREDRGIRSLVHPEDQARYHQTQDAALLGDCDWQWQGRILTRDGELRWADIKATARSLGEGRVVWDGIVWDITENKQVELALAESRAHLRELAAHLVEHGTSRSHERFDRRTLLARGLLHALQQGVDVVHERGPLLQRGVVALGELAHVAAQLGDHVGSGLGRFGGGVDQARHRRFERTAQLGEVGGHLRVQGRLQLAQALRAGLGARRFFAAQRGQLVAPEGGGLFQRVGCGLLLRQRLCTQLLPFALQRGPHGLQAVRPRGVLLLAGRGLFGVCAARAVLHTGDQRGAAFFEGGGEPGQRTVQPLHLLLAGAGVVLQGRGPGLGHAARGVAPALGQAAELRLHGGAQALVLAGGFLRDGRHGFLHHGLQALACGARAGAQAFLERALHRLRQPPVGLVRFHVEGGLAGEQLVVQLLVATVDLAHERLQLVRHRRQRTGLLLQRVERRLALLRQREGAKHGGGAGVQQAGRVGALAPAQRRHQTEHGGGGHTHHRGAKGQTQAFDGRGQRRTNGLQVGRAFEREHHALEGDHHAQEGAQHAEHDQQADQVGRERQAGQRTALAFDALAHRIAQGGGHALQPVGQRGQRLRHVGQRLRQRRGGLPVAPDFLGAEQVHATDEHGHGQRKGAGAHETRAHPHDGRQPQGKGSEEKQSVQGVAVHGLHSMAFQRFDHAQEGLQPKLQLGQQGVLKVLFKGGGPRLGLGLPPVLEARLEKGRQAREQALLAPAQHLVERGVQRGELRELRRGGGQGLAQVLAQRVNAHFHAALLVEAALVVRREFGVAGLGRRVRRRADGLRERGAQALELGAGIGHRRACRALARDRQCRQGLMGRIQCNRVRHVQPAAQALGQVLAGQLHRRRRPTGELAHQGRTVEMAAQKRFLGTRWAGAIDMSVCGLAPDGRGRRAERAGVTPPARPGNRSRWCAWGR